MAIIAVVFRNGNIFEGVIGIVWMPCFVTVAGFASVRGHWVSKMS